jgi:hypothetical protein
MLGYRLQTAVYRLTNSRSSSRWSHDPAHDDFAASRDTFLNRSGVEFAVMDGAMNVSGSQRLRATCMVTNFSRNESLEEAITVSVTVKRRFAAISPV